jgi:colanic acid/amylovoran biosynthesis glycosyltransferase
MHIGVIASMKKGLEQFIYREVCALEACGASITIFPTKHAPGLYNPKPTWLVVRWQLAAVLLCQPLRFLQMPVRYTSVLVTAIRYRAIIDFLLASYFLPEMRNVDALYATFGDRKLFVGYFGKMLLGKPLAVEIHAYELYQNPNPRLFPIALAACDQIVAATEHNRNILRDRYGVDPRKVEVVRYSIDLHDYRPERKLVVLIVAFFVEKKGHDILLQAIKQLDRSDVEVWIVGGDGGSDAKVDVPAIVKELGLESRVAFFGKLSGTALKAVYRACDVFCIPSRHDRNGDAEGFPNVLIEAMASGKPVVTTRHVEIPRIVEQMLVDENDVDGLAAALDHVLDSAALRERLGERNRVLAEEHFSTANVDATWSLLNQIAGRDLGNKSATRSPQACSTTSCQSASGVENREAVAAR